MSTSTTTAAPEPQVVVTVARPTLRGHIAIARVDHWVKQVFVLPGIQIGRAHV